MKVMQSKENDKEMIITGRATWTLNEIEKVFRKVYTTKKARDIQLNSIVADAERTQDNSDTITLTNVVNGMYNSHANIAKFFDILRELDRL
jgi:hypothetical protein